MRAITHFSGPWRDFSNFALREVRIWGLKFSSNEHGFVFAKNPEHWVRRFHDPNDALDWDTFNGWKPGKVKREGRKIKLIHRWDEVKLEVMRDLCWAKFTQHDDLRELLLSTGIAKLIEGNHWHDTFWGVCNGECRTPHPEPEGDNHLGKTLMHIRTLLRRNDDG